MTPICKPVVNTQLNQMNGLQRAAESFCYTILSIEYWISPDGAIRSWLRMNSRLCVWMIIPGVVVIPVVSLILWQLAFWFSMFTGKLFVLILVLFIARRMIKR